MKERTVFERVVVMVRFDGDEPVTKRKEANDAGNSSDRK